MQGIGYRTGQTRWGDIGILFWQLLRYTMPDANPYESPSLPVSQTPDILADRARARSMMLGLVLATVCLNLILTVPLISQVSAGRIAEMIFLWIGMPLWGARLMWRGRKVGRWILVILFGMRVIGALVGLHKFAFGLAHPPDAVRYGRLVQDVLEIGLYGTTFVWLMVSAKSKGLCRTAK